MASLTSAAGVLSLLDEPNAKIKVHAIKKLDGMVDNFWAEIANALEKIEALHEDSKFEARETAALVYYHLEEHDDALKFALCAGETFNVSDKTEYVETLLSKCIDEYVRLRIEESEMKLKAEEVKTEPIDKRLVSIVDQMFERCYEHKQFEQALGIAVESRRLDRLAQCITKS
eukprot:532757-Amorphochlora_amoeboformis.AAC.1